MKYIRIILALVIWFTIGGTVWYAGHLLFDHTIRSYQSKHSGVELTDFPWNKAYTPEERWNLLKSFTYVRHSTCYDSLYSPLSQIEAFRNREQEEMFLNLYDVFFLRPQSDTTGKSLFFSEIRRISGFRLRTNSEIESYLKNCLPQIVVIKEAVLQQILSSIWKDRNKSIISHLGNILNIIYFIFFFISLMLVMFGKKGVVSILKFDELKH
jgi:hypothetical protein